MKMCECPIVEVDITNIHRREAEWRAKSILTAAATGMITGLGIHGYPLALEHMVNLLAATPGVVDWARGWIYIKLVAVAALTLIHHRLALWRRDFAADANRRPARFYRVVNEIPTVLLVLIVIMVVVKPF